MGHAPQYFLDSSGMIYRAIDYRVQISTLGVGFCLCWKAREFFSTGLTGFFLGLLIQFLTAKDAKKREVDMAWTD
jgi:hypothetical protein